MNATPSPPSSRTETLSQLVRFGVVGILTNGAVFALYLLITHMGMPPKIAMTLLYALGATMGFFSNRAITFSHTGSVSKAAFRYVVAYALGYLLNLSLLFVFVDHAGLPHQAVQFSAIFIVAAFLFAIQKFFVFKDST